MAETLLSEAKVDRGAFSVASLDEADRMDRE
jgi:hypothetical protein